MVELNKLIKWISAILMVMNMSGITSTSMPILASNQVATEREIQVHVLRPVSHHSQSQLQVDMEDITWVELKADLTELGGQSAVPINIDEGILSFGVSSEIQPGMYQITIWGKDEAEVEYESRIEVEVVEEELSEDEIAWDEEIIYFLLTDRFYDGNPTNNDPYEMNYSQADNRNGTYLGGDFKGITEKMDYLSELGVTTIWISPIVSNIKYDVNEFENQGEFYGYHGYWADDFETLNPHFGTIEELHELIDTASHHNIKIMVDVVLNHTGYGLNVLPDNLTNTPMGFPTDEDRARFEGMIRTDPGNDPITQELSGLPDFITEDYDVMQQIVEWQKDWIDKSTTQEGNAISSFRVDTVKHIAQPQWQQFKNAMTEDYPNFHLMGELWGASVNNTQGHLYTGSMDALIDFDFVSIAQQFVNGNITGSMQKLIQRNDKMNSTGLLNPYLSSHDVPGFLYTINNLDKFKLAVSLQLTSKGQPVIYYGEEIGMTGANNWPIYDNRYAFDWDRIDDNPILDHYKKLIAFRREFAPILARGQMRVIEENSEEKWVLFERYYEGDSVYIGLNLSDQPVTIPLPLNASDSVILTDYYSNQLTMRSTRQPSEWAPVLTIPAMQDGGTLLLHVEGSTIKE